jgi:putative salt-induced outer membrane protein YdiY
MGFRYARIKDVVCVFLGVGFMVFPLLLSRATADEVRLANGDRLTGEIVRMENQTLILKTGYAKDIQLTWADVVCVTSDKEHTFVLKDNEVLIGRAVCADPGKIQILGAVVGESAELPPDQLESINPTPPRPAITYRGNVTGGGSMTSGNTDDTVGYFSTDFEARSRRHRFTIGGRYNYGETDNEITTRNALGRVKYDFFVTERLYAYAHGLFEGDEFQDLNLRSTAGVGAGYQFIDTERTSLFGELGLSYVNEDFDVGEDNDYNSGRESVGFTFQVIPERITFFHLHELYFGLDESDQYYFRAEQGVRFVLFRNFFANFQANYAYTRQPAPGRKNADLLYIAGLGYEFSF